MKKSGQKRDKRFQAQLIMTEIDKSSPYLSKKAADKRRQLIIAKIDKTHFPQNLLQSPLLRKLAEQNIEVARLPPATPALNSFNIRNISNKSQTKSYRKGADKKIQRPLTQLTDRRSESMELEGAERKNQMRGDRPVTSRGSRREFSRQHQNDLRNEEFCNKEQISKILLVSRKGKRYPHEKDEPQGKTLYNKKKTLINSAIDDQFLSLFA